MLLVWGVWGGQLPCPPHTPQILHNNLLVLLFEMQTLSQGEASGIMPFASAQDGLFRADVAQSAEQPPCKW